MTNTVIAENTVTNTTVVEVNGTVVVETPVTNVVTATASGPAGPGGNRGNCGIFYDTTNQASLGADLVNTVSYNTTEKSIGVSIVNGTRITFAQTGTYNIQFSLQLSKTDAGTDLVDVWLAKNGANVADTNTMIEVRDNNGKNVAAWNFMFDAVAGDYYELKWSSPDHEMSILYRAAQTTPTRPATPSVIMTVQQVMYTQNNAKRSVVLPSAYTITINSDICDIAVQNNTEMAGTVTINAPLGTPLDTQQLQIRLKCDNAQSLVWDSIFRGSSTIPLPTLSTGSSKADYMGFQYNQAAGKWDMLARNFNF